MFERFSEASRQVVVQAQKIARELSHAYIGTEHLLLAMLLNVEEIPAQVLGSFGVDAETVRVLVVERVGRGGEPTGTQIPFTSRAKKTLELGLREALSLRHNAIRPGHLFLGLLRVEEGLGFQLLLDLNVTPGTARERTIERLGGPDKTAEQKPQATRLTAGEVVFAVQPDVQLRGLLRDTAARALQDEREEFGVADLLKAIREQPELRGLLDPDDQ